MLDEWYSAFRPLTPIKRELTRRAVVDAGDTASLSANILWLRADVYHKFFDLQRICEAISMLALLQRANPREWRAQIADIWLGEADEVLQLSRPVVLGVELEDSYNAWQRLQELLLRSNAPSEAFLKVSERYLPRVRESKRRAHLAVPVRIGLKTSYSQSGDALAKPLKQARDAAEAQYSTYTKTGATTATHPHNLLEEFRLGWAKYEELSYESLAHMRAIQECGVRPPSLMVLNLSEGEAMINVARALQSLLSLDATPHGVDTIQITRPHESVPVLLSAVQHSPSVKYVDIKLFEPKATSWDVEGDEDQRDMWRWIAYTLFSKFSTHTIEELRVDFQHIVDDDLEVVRDILSSDDPLALLIDDASPSAVRLSARTFHLCDHPPSTTTGDYELVETRTPTIVPIVAAPVEREYEWWEVWFPGYGLAFVHSRDIVERLPVDVEHQPPVFPRLQITQSLETEDIWDEDDIAWRRELELLQLIGHGTQELTIISYHDAVDFDNGVARVLAACPQLKLLKLEGVGMENLQVFVDSAIAGHAKLQRLVADEVQTTEPDSITSFFQALAVKTHPLTEHLEEIELTFKADTYRAANPVWKAALAMLAKNRSLRVISLTVEVGKEPFTADEDMTETCFEHVPEYAVATGPLPLPCKLAFLSVVAGHQVHPVKQLDTLVLSRIFQFSVTCVERQLSVVCRGPGTDVLFNVGSDDESEEEEDDDVAYN